MDEESNMLSLTPRQNTILQGLALAGALIVAAQWSVILFAH
jgi:hypothetical protein